MDGLQGRLSEDKEKGPQKNWQLKAIRDGLLKDNEFKSMSAEGRYAYAHGVLDMYNELVKEEKLEMAAK